MSNFKVKPRPHGEWQAICPTCGPFAKGASPAIANDMCRAHVCRSRITGCDVPDLAGGDRAGRFVVAAWAERWWGTPPRGGVWV